MNVSTKMTAVLVVALLGVAACGGGATTNDSAAPSSNSSNPATFAAMKKLQPYLSIKSTISIKPLENKPPTGKTISYIACSLSSCKEYQQALEAASAKIGWTVRVTQGGLTPDTQASAWNSVAQNPGDAVVAVPTVPNAALSEQLKILQSKNVPVVEFGGPSSPTAPVIGQFNNPNQSQAQGQIWADWITADSNADAKIVYYTDPSFESLHPYGAGLNSELKSACPKCSVDQQSTSFSTGIGTSIPTQVVSYLQRNPDVKYVIINVGDAAVGVAQALASAGLSKQVKIVTGAAGPPNVKAIKDGSQAMAVVGERFELGWRAIDLIIRHLQGVQIVESEPVVSLHVITRDNLPQNVDVPYSVPGYQDSFLKAWGVTS